MFVCTIHSFIHYSSSVTPPNAECRAGGTACEAPMGQDKVAQSREAMRKSTLIVLIRKKREYEYGYTVCSIYYLKNF